MFTEHRRSLVRTHPLPQDPPERWLRGQPANHECAFCLLCTKGVDCPTAAHPYNLRGDTGLRCYQCSSCSHENYTPARTTWGNLTTKAKELPKPYAKPAKKHHSNSQEPYWCVSVPIHIDTECPRWSLLEYRVALAELMKKAKVTVNKGDEVGDVDWRVGINVNVYMKPHTPKKFVREEARETVKNWLKDMNMVWVRRMDIILQDKEAEESKQKLEEEMEAYREEQQQKLGRIRRIVEMREAGRRMWNAELRGKEDCAVTTGLVIL